MLHLFSVQDDRFSDVVAQRDHPAMTLRRPSDFGAFGLLSGVALFDLVISAGEQRRWDSETNRLGGPEVDKKLKFRGLLNRKIGGFCPFEDLVDERACASVQARHVRSIGCKHA